MHNILKLTLFALSGISILFISSCTTDEPNGTVNPVDIVFKAMYDDRPLVINERYDLNGKEITITRFQFYISDLALKDGNMDVSINEIDFMDFTQKNISEAAALEGITVSRASVPIGEYDGLKLSIGVPSDLNEYVPADYSSSHPLGLGSEHWAAWNSYIFSKVDGRFDTNSEPTVLEGSIQYHLGTDDMFRKKEFSELDISIKEGAVKTIIIEIDAKKIFENGNNGYLDLATEGETHTNPNEPGQIELATRLADNWLNAIMIQ